MPTHNHPQSICGATDSDNLSTFQIDAEVQLKYPELVKLIKETESIDDNEKQYWFDILPTSTDEQIDRLFTILSTEKEKLEQVDIEYQKEIRELNRRHLQEWQEFQKQPTK